MKTKPSLMILIAGPYRSGTGDDPALMEKNLRTLEEAALPLFRAGHIPVIGEWLALPLLREAGCKLPGDDAWEEILYPVANRLLTRCDGVLRLPGASKAPTKMCAWRWNSACLCGARWKRCRAAAQQSLRQTQDFRAGNTPTADSEACA